MALGLPQRHDHESRGGSVQADDVAVALLDHPLLGEAASRLQRDG